MISQEKLETYQLAMFPLMLQALYNAKITLGFIPNASGGKLLDNGKGRRETFEDVKMIVDAFKSVGISRRFGKETVDNGWVLRHFNNNEIAKVVKLFNPDAEERDQEMDELKQKHRKTQKDLVDTISRRNTQLKELLQERGRLHKRLAELESRLASREVRPDTAAVLSDMLKYPMTANEMRMEIRRLLRIGKESMPSPNANI